MGSLRDAQEKKTRGAYRQMDSKPKRALGKAWDQVGAFAQSYTEQIPFADEAAAGMVAALRPDASYQDVRDAQKRLAAEDRRERPLARNAGGVAGFTTTFAAPGGAYVAGGRAGQLALRAGHGGAQMAARGAQVGSGYGVLSAAGAAEGGAGERLRAAGDGAVIGAATGGASPRLAKAGAGLVNKAARQFRPAADKSVAKAGRILQARGVQRVTIATGAVPYQEMGRGAKSLARAVANVPGPGQGMAERALLQRQEQAVPNMLRSVTDELGDSGAGFHASSEHLDETAKRLSRPLYEQAEAVGPMQSQQLDDLAQRPSVRRAVARAVSLAAEEGEDPRALGLLGEKAPPRTFTDHVKGLAAEAPERPEVVAADFARTGRPVVFGGVGPGGPRLIGLQDDLPSTFEALARMNDGEAIGVLAHPDVPGAVDLPWGWYDPVKDRGAGVAKIVGKHDEMIEDLERVWPLMKSVPRTVADSRIQLKYGPYTAVVEQARDGRSQTWLLTTFDKGAGARRLKAAKRANRLGAGTVASDAVEGQAQRPQAPRSPDQPVADNISQGGATSYTARTWNYVKRGLDDLIEKRRDPVTGRLPNDQMTRALQNARLQLRSELDRINPAYGRARAAYAGPAAQKQAMQQGRRAVTSRADPDMVERGVESLSADERAAYRVGAARGLSDQFRGANPQGVARRLTRDQVLQDRLRAGFPDDESFGRFLSDVQSEAAAQTEINKVLGGSRTTPLREDIDAANLAGEGGDIASRLVDVEARRLSGQSLKRQATEAGLRSAFSKLRVPALNDPEVSRILGQALFEGKGVQEALQAAIAQRVLSPETALRLVPGLSQQAAAMRARSAKANRTGAPR